MSGRITRHADPEYARQAALRGATLLVLVSIVMAGAPRGEFASAAAPQPQREARLASAGERVAAVSPADSEDEHGPAALGGEAVVRAGAPAVERAPARARGVVRALVRVALLDLPPPAC